ncbi:MAG: heme-binding domain-containing protein [Bacteroidales bacterium]|nr:heme-binding domain-containing protein [Bacteroidales bacterium]
MKKTITLGILLIGLVTIISAFSIKSGSVFVESDFNSPKLLVDEFPDDVAKILKVHCNDCHVAASKNTKAKGKLNFDKWDDYSMMKKTGKLNDIIETVNDGKMPPKKYLEKYPDKKLSKDQIKLVTDWAQKTMDSFKD